MQDALTSALSHWPQNGVPKNPENWLFQVAKRKAIDRLRRVATQHAKAPDVTYQLQMQEAMKDDIDIRENQSVPDERLSLIFTCCHPALPAPAHTALTLKTVCGLSTAQIASAFLISETAMAQRIVRAKNKIKKAGIPFTLPDPSLWPERWKSVLAVVYLIFNEGYSALHSKNKDVDLCEEAIRLGRILARLLPKEPEATGLLALMLLSHARRPARQAESDIFIALKEQDRTLWDKNKIKEGQALLIKALTQGKPGPYQIQAAICAVHCQAENFEKTDWSEITALYERLYAYEPSPVVLLNASVALSYFQSPKAGLASLSLIAQNTSMQSYQPYHAARADMLLRNGQIKLAKQAYRKALTLTVDEAGRNFLKVMLKNISE